MMVSLFVETQRSVILNGSERLDTRAFESTFRANFTNMLPYLDLGQEKTLPTKKAIPQITTPKNKLNAEEDLFTRTAKTAEKNLSAMITMLAEQVNVEFVVL